MKTLKVNNNSTSRMKVTTTTRPSISVLKQVRNYYKPLDAGATRPKGRIPLWKLNLENESEIPQMPTDILEKPNDKHYEKELAQLDTQIKHHEKSIVSLLDRIILNLGRN
jgi:hypothetical protein